MPYRNRPMTRDEAEDHRITVGLLLSDRDARGEAIPGTVEVGLCARGEGFSAIVPLEKLAELYDRGYRDAERAIRRAILDTSDAGDY